MANTKSSEKRIRSNERKHLRNQMYRSRVKTMIRKAEETIFAGQPSEESIRLAMSTLDRAAVKGIIHKNNAARRKSRLAKKLAKFKAAVPAVVAETPAKKTRSIVLVNNALDCCLVERAHRQANGIFARLAAKDRILGLANHGLDPRPIHLVAQVPALIRPNTLFG